MSDHLTNAGIEEGVPRITTATFGGYPLWYPGMVADAVILGVPFDEGGSSRPGARFAPRAIREASRYTTYAQRAGRYYDADRRRWILIDKVIADAGDVDIEPLCLERNQRMITEAVRAICAADAVPLAIGGDHSVTFPLLQGVRRRPLNYLHVDAHIDCDRFLDSPYTHGSPVARILEHGLADSITIVGIRGLANSGHDVEWAERKGVRMITAREWLGDDHNGLFQLLPFGDYYVSVDIDVFDPAVAPGTGTPEPGGLLFPHFSILLQRVAERGQIVGADLMEVNPYLDGPGNVTSHLAARCIFELLSAALD